MVTLYKLFLTPYFNPFVRPPELPHDSLPPRPGLGGPFFPLLDLRSGRLLVLLFGSVVVLCSYNLGE